MQTDLKKILSVSGQRGLFQYVAQARNGVIAENLEDKKRTVFPMTSRLSTLSDISIYTTETEMKLEEVFAALRNTLSDSEAPSSKAAESEIVDLFAKAIPNYDSERFYISHMRKVVDWYNILFKYASLDFVKDAEEEA